MTPRNEPPTKLESAVANQGRTIEGLGLRVELMDQHLDRIAGNIESLTEQIGRLTEATFETQNLLRQSGDRRDVQIDRLLDQQGSKLDRISETIQGQNRVAEAQASNIAALTRLVETLVSRN